VIGIFRVTRSHPHPHIVAALQSVSIFIAKMVWKTTDSLKFSAQS